MQKRSKKNIYSISLLALAVAMVILYACVFPLSNFENLVFWFVLAVISETFQIMNPSGMGTSVGIAIYLYIAIMASPLDVVIVASLAMLLRFPEEKGQRKHLLNSHPITSIFNVANICLSMGLASLVFVNVDPYGSLMRIVIRVLVALFIAEVTNMCVLYGVFRIDDDKEEHSFFVIFKSLLSTFPSTVAISTLGIFLVFAETHYGKEIVLLFFIPLLLARYSFKLYFESQSAALDTIHALNEALNAKDEYTGGHTDRVKIYSVALAKAYNLSHKDVDVETIRTAALLHDIGKIGIPDSILNKPGELTEEEMAKIRQHPRIGADILANVNSLDKISKIIIQHHERYDGQGYPGGIKGDEIMLEAAILMVADSYDAMTSDRAYRKAFSQDKAIEELRLNKGTQFRPDLVDCFVDMLIKEKKSNPSTTNDKEKTQIKESDKVKEKKAEENNRSEIEKIEGLSRI